MASQPTFLRSRVSRRITFFFVVAALIPTVLLGSLTYRSVSTAQRQQQQKDLVEASRAYALALLGRMTLARSIAVDIVADLPDDTVRAVERYPMFDLIQRIVPLQPSAESTPGVLAGEARARQRGTASAVTIEVRAGASAAAAPDIFFAGADAGRPGSGASATQACLPVGR